MSPLQLLTVGQSFKGTKTEVGVYKLPQENFLPKFRAAAPLVSTSPQPIPKRVPVQTGLSFDPQPKAQPVAAAPFLEKARIPDKAPRADQSRRDSASTVVRKGKWSLYEILFMRGTPRKASVTPIQIEWPLEKVSVVRNDLSDADLELVPARAQTSSNPGPALGKEVRETSDETGARSIIRFFTFNRVRI